MTTIAGYTLTRTERRTLDAVRAYLLHNAADSHASLHTSPKGDGRVISLTEVFPNGTESRRAIERLEEIGVLRACEIKCADGEVFWWPLSLKPCYCGGGGMEHDNKNADCPRNVKTVRA